MSRFRLAVAGLALIVLALPAAAAAAVQLRGVDASAYPTIRASIYTPNGGGRPALWENGTPVVGFQAQNLGSVKAIATLIDRSQSMRGKPLADASAGARAFVAVKRAPDELSVIAFGSKVSTLSPFSTVKRDADLPLSNMKTDSIKGTALYDAVIAAANQLKGNPLPGRVIIVLSDGADNASHGSLATAIRAAGEANALVYAIGIEGEGFTADPLKELASATGASTTGAARRRTRRRLFVDRHGAEEDLASPVRHGRAARGQHPAHSVDRRRGLDHTACEDPAGRHDFGTCSVQAPPGERVWPRRPACDRHRRRAARALRVPLLPGRHPRLMSAQPHRRAHR
jgi:uncharacterized protein YegL